MDQSLNINAPTLSTQFANINQLWASLFIEELLRHGISDFCIAPGSRSAPLTLAVANHHDATSHLHFDERGLGFLALGISLAKQKPVVIITTSGTAVANLYPAVIEAKQSNVPLIVISADRPADLLNCGANQAINQDSIFANYPVFFTQIPSPTTQLQPNYLLTTIDQGLQTQLNTPAPIHFNIAFSEPLYPNGEIIDYQEYLQSLSKWQQQKLPFTQYIETVQTQQLSQYIDLATKKVIVIAAHIAEPEQAKAISEFAKKNDHPLIADVQSSISGHKHNLHYYDLLLNDSNFVETLQQADIIIQFGDQLVSKRLSQFITAFTGEYWLVKEGHQRIDPSHRLNKRFNCSAKQWLSSYTDCNSDSTSVNNKQWLNTLCDLNQQLTNKVISPFLAEHQLSEISVVSVLDNLLLDNAPLFIGNSMPIRLADMFFEKNTSLVFSNRGASGIDGLIATSIGVAKSNQQATTLLIGDTSFLYDLNSLALLSKLASPFVAIVFNNDGGSIFNLLPVPEQHMQTYYQLPHGLTFSDTCKQFDINYFQPTQLDEFVDIYKKSLNNGISLIEICTKNAQTSEHLKQLKEKISYATL
ncbi:MAG: 2-succinyl-5-enolpyruvyl-6-hydroxy-3-cyclohexene-1-carboxylic-acid synthase [Psychromonas sp.]